MPPPSSFAFPTSTSPPSSSTALRPASPPPSSTPPPPPPPAPALDLHASVSSSPKSPEAEEISLLPTTRSSSEDSSLRKSSGSEEEGGGGAGAGSRESRQVVFLPTLAKDSSATKSDLSFKIDAPFMDRGGPRMSGMSYSSSSGSGSLSGLSVPKGQHSPRRESSTYDFRSSMLRPMSYASEIGFDPEAGSVQVEVYESGVESDDWMYSSEKEMDEVMKASTSYGHQPFFIFMRVANLFCLIFLILLLLLLFIGYPILDRFVLHGFSGGGRYAPNPVARPLGTYGPESSFSTSFDGAVVETLTAATTTAAATITGGLFGRRVST